MTAPDYWNPRDYVNVLLARLALRFYPADSSAARQPLLDNLDKNGGSRTYYISTGAQSRYFKEGQVTKTGCFGRWGHAEREYRGRRMGVSGP
jgi:hypothetical protein